jgi:hypothetical protein
MKPLIYHGALVKLNKCIRIKPPASTLERVRRKEHIMIPIELEESLSIRD